MSITKLDKLTAIAVSVFRLNGQLIEWGDHFSLLHGLTSARWQVLGAISMAQQPPNIPHIAATMGVTRQGVLKQIKLLLDEGLIQSLPNPMHKRSPLYVLTDAGRSAYAALSDRWRQHLQEVCPDFSNADLDAAIRVLSAMSRVHAGSAKT